MKACTQAVGKDKWKIIKHTLATIQKQLGKESIMALGDASREAIPTISSGCPSLDLALGGTGYPRGRIVEVFGPESSGKTTLTLHAVAEAQRNGGLAAFIDAEHALDTRYAEALGVDLAPLLVSQPDTGEQALDIVDALVRSEVVDIIVVDSVAALVPKAEIEGDMGDQHVGLQARLMSRALRKLTGNAHRGQTSIFFINQLRSKIGNAYGSPETTTGGNALKYYASVRVDIRRIGALKVGEAIIGNRTRARVVKNKVAPPFQSVEFDIRYGTGIDAIGDQLDRCVALGRVEKNGSYFSYKGQTLGQGREKARQALVDDPALLDELRSLSAAPSPPASASLSPSQVAQRAA